MKLRVFALRVAKILVMKNYLVLEIDKFVHTYNIEIYFIYIQMSAKYRAEVPLALNMQT